MANTGWIDASNPNITFRGLYKIASIGTNSFTTGDMGVNGGGAELAIDIDDALINNGTINSVQIKYTCYGSRTSSAYAKGTARTGYITSGSSYSWEATHAEAVGRGSSNKTTFTDTFVPKRSTSDGKYHLLIGARNNINALTNSVVFSNISIYIDYTPHTHTTEVRNTAAATCTTDGYTGDTYCKTCGELISSGAKLPALGHSFTNYVSDGNATCTADGTKTAKCDRCGATNTIADTGSALGHNYIEELIEPTVSSHGCKRYTCTRCGDTYETDIKYLISVEASPPEGGTVSGGGVYDAGDEMTITATPATGWFVLEWLKNGEKYLGVGSESISIPAEESALFTINFIINSYKLTLNAENGRIIGGTSGNYYEHGTPLILRAVPDAGYKFVKWSDGVTDDTRTVTISSAVTYTAIFERLTYRVRWYNENGSNLLETDPAVPYGTMPEYNGATPTKAETDQYKYTHIGWNVNPTTSGTVELTAVVDNIDYYARFSSTEKGYTVKWVNYDGTVLETDRLVPNGNPPDYNGTEPTKPDSEDGKYTYTFLGWSANVEDPPLEEGDLPAVSGDITYTAVYLPVVRKYNLDVVAYDCTVEGAAGGEYEYGTEFKVKVTPDFGYEVDEIQLYIVKDNEVHTYQGDSLDFILTSDMAVIVIAKRVSAPFFINPEQQVKDIYIVPAINTIVYIVDGALPTLQTTMHTVDDLHFAVINTDIDSSAYADYLYYPVEQLYVKDKNSNTKRVW